MGVCSRQAPIAILAARHILKEREGGLNNLLNGILNKFPNADLSQLSPNVNAHFESVAQSAQPDTLALGIFAAFRSDQPPISGRW
jgi:hypothetical protein